MKVFDARSDLRLGIFAVDVYLGLEGGVYQRRTLGLDANFFVELVGLEHDFGEQNLGFGYALHSSRLENYLPGMFGSIAHEFQFQRHCNLLGLREYRVGKVDGGVQGLFRGITEVDAIAIRGIYPYGFFLAGERKHAAQCGRSNINLFIFHLDHRF